MKKQRMKDSNRSKSASGHDGDGLRAAWRQACESMCTISGTRPQLEGYRFQMRKAWIPSLRPFADMQWFGWVAFPQVACRFAPACALDCFHDDLARWRASHADQPSGFPAGDLPIKTIFESRGRITIPEQMALAAGILPNTMPFVMVRAIGCIEVWFGNRFTGYCAETASAQHPICSP